MLQVVTSTTLPNIWIHFFGNVYRFLILLFVEPGGDISFDIFLIEWSPLLECDFIILCGRFLLNINLFGPTIGIRRRREMSHIKFILKGIFSTSIVNDFDLDLRLGGSGSSRDFARISSWMGEFLRSSRMDIYVGILPR